MWAPLAVYLIDRFDFAWALRIMGVAFFCAVAALSRMVRTAPTGYVPAGWDPPGAQVDGAGTRGDLDWKRMMRTPEFAVLGLLFIAGTLSGMMVIGHASPIAQQVLDITPEAAAESS